MSSSIHSVQPRKEVMHLKITSVETSQTATFFFFNLEHPRMETVIKDVTHTQDGHTRWRVECNKYLM